MVASDFDEQTLSAVAWLNSNNVDMSCYRLTPYKLNEDLFFYVEKLLPVTNYEDYYVNLMDKTVMTTVAGDKKITRSSLPKIDLMLEWGAVKEGDIIVAKGKEDEGRLLSNGNVMVNGEEKSMQAWLKKSVVLLNDNGPADILLQGKEVQMKFYANILEEIKQASNYDKMSMLFPKDHLEVIEEIMSGAKSVEFNGNICRMPKLIILEKLLKMRALCVAFLMING